MAAPASPSGLGPTAQPGAGPGGRQGSRTKGWEAAAILEQASGGGHGERWGLWEGKVNNFTPFRAAQD